MNTMVVQAHPVPDSFNAAVLDRVQAGLAHDAHTASIFRLGLGERPSVDQLDGVTRLVLVYPTWWGGQPAVLVDWLQELVLADGDPLASVDEVCAVTTCGGSKVVNITQGQWGKRWLRQQLMSRCQEGATFEWCALYKMDRLTPERAERYLSEIERRFSP